MRGQILRQAHRGQDLRLFRGQVGRRERHRLLHGGQREQLQQVVLDHVAGRADAVVVPGSAGHADVLGHGDLHVVNVVGVPDRLVHGVREAQRQHVLHGFLAEVMVDAEHARGVEDLGDHAVELLGALKIMAERLFDDHAAPRAFGGAGQTAVGELAGHHRERARRHRHVERVVAARATVAVQLGHGVRQALEGLRIVEGALHEADAGGQLRPRRFLERRAAVRDDVLAHEILEMILGPVAAGEAGQPEARRQQAAVGQIVDGGKQFLARQIAGHAEDHDAARPRDARQAQIARIAQRIGPVFRRDRTARAGDGCYGITHIYLS